MDVGLIAFDDSLRPRLAVGVVFSLLAHVGAAMVILVRPPGFEGPPPRPLVAPTAEREDPPIRPGIEESSVVSINWLGFSDPTEHHATPAETEQAALSPADVGVPEVVEPVEVATEAETPAEVPETEPAPDMARADPDPAPAEETAAESFEEAAAIAESPTETPEPDAEAVPDPPVLALQTDAPEPRPTPLLQVVRRATARARALAASAAARAAAAAPPPGEPREALRSEKESDATSTDEIAEWLPGRPPAVAGLEITPVRPKWTVTTRLSAVPRNPVVRIDFRKNGTVARAQFLPGQDTGYPDVDGPLLDALYRWTARGKALDQLSAADPKAVISFPMRIVLIPERGTIRRSTPSR